MNADIEIPPLPPKPPPRFFSDLCDSLGVKPAEVVAQDRTAWLVKTRRYIAATMCKAGYSTTEVGDVMERNHSSVLHLIGARVRKKKKKKARHA